MSFWSRFREPSPDDYDSYEEYEDALDSYERAESLAIDEYEEAFHAR